MDAERFDRLVRSLAAMRSRRGLLPALAAWPLIGGLAAILGHGEAEADGRRRRRVKRHKHGKPRRHGQRQQPCQPKSTAKTCAGRCGAVKNNCQKMVDCGSCACASHAECVAADRGGRCCDGECFAGDCCITADCSGATPICVGHTCDACSASQSCPNGGCCTGEGCIANGAACNDGNLCTTNDSCQSGVCSGAPVTCDTPNECQNLPGDCGPSSGDCTYPAKADGARCGNQCMQACTGGVCGSGSTVTCPANECQNAGTCDPTTGACPAPTNKAPGTPCEGVPCGACNGSGACVSRCAAGGCCDAGETCVPQGQNCSNGAECCNGQCACITGVCRVSPMGAICCCTVPEQICADIPSGGNCELP